MTHLRPSALWLAAAIAGILLAACGEPTPAPTARPPQPTAAPTAVYATVAPSVAPTRPPAAASATPVATPSPAPALPAPNQRPTPLPVTPSPAPALPDPTPHPHNSAWVGERLDAVIALYRPTAAGAALLRSLDLRQMPGEPGFFGSYGFGGWAGVGEVKPVGVMHELMHSYWGGFPVIGRPELGWERREGEHLAPALSGYHQDILTFMAQPPDDYEMLRQRLRNLPGLSAENTEPLLHSLEADLPYSTGGDLALAPPILRKYWGHFLADGPFHTWERAAGWYRSLSHDRRSVADKFLGFQHFDLRQYANDTTYAIPDNPLSAAAPQLAGEERQRLTDFANNFDLLLGESQPEEDFRFWRGYLQDKTALYRAYPSHLDSLPMPRAADIAAALEFLSALPGDPAERALLLAGRIPAQPFLVNFLPAVDNPTLLMLFANDPDLPDAPTLQATASFVNRLQRFAAEVDRVLEAARQSPENGARALEGFLAETGYEQEQDLQLFFNLFRDADTPTARRIMAAVSKETIRALMPPVPVQLRSVLQPEVLLARLDITAESSPTDLRRGITLLIEETSGNYRIEETYLDLLYEVMAQRAQESPGETAQVIAETPFPLEGMILHQPLAAAIALSSNLDRAVALVENSDPVTAPPPRIIYRLITADPHLAATLLIALEQRGQRDMAAESLAYFAYDKIRSESYPQLLISLSRDGAFLNSLLQRQGAAWLQTRLGEVAALYRQRIAEGEVAADFLARYRETLEAAANTLEPEARGRLMGIIGALSF